MAAVVPTHHRPRAVGRLVERLLDDPATTEIVVVNDGADTATSTALERVRDDRLRVIDVHVHSAARARHIGVEVATADVVVVLDDDVVPRPGLMSAHRRHHGDGERLVVGYLPTVVPDPGHPSHVTATMYAASYEQHCAAYETDPDSILLRLWGGNYSLPRHACRRVGLHDPGYPAVDHNDRDFGLRCLADGLAASFDRSIVADHVYDRPPRAAWRDARRQGEGRRHLHERHADLIGAPEPIHEADRIATRIAAALCATGPGDRVVTALASAVATGARRARLFSLERYVVHRMRAAELVVGAA